MTALCQLGNGLATITSPRSGRRGEIPAIPLGKASKALEFTEDEKVSDPQVVSGDAPNPTKL